MAEPPDEADALLPRPAGPQVAESEAKAVAALLKRHGVAKGARILDAPSGPGHLAVQLARIGYRVSGIDPSQAHIDGTNLACKRMGLEGRLDVSIGDLREVGASFRGRTFDAALILRQSLGHWDEETDVSILRQLCDLTEDKGALIVDVLNRDHIVKHMTNFGVTRLEDDTERHEMRRLNYETSHLEMIVDLYRREGENLKHLSTAKMQFRVYALHEVRDLLRRSGWNPAEEFGSFQQEPVGMEKKRLILVASKA